MTERATAPAPYRPPADRLAAARVGLARRVAFILLGGGAVVIYCAGTFRPEYFWILLLFGSIVLAGLFVLPRTWRELGRSLDVTWSVASDGLHWTWGDTRGVLAFADVAHVVIRNDRVVLHGRPRGANEIVAGAPGFEELCAQLRIACEHAGVPVGAHKPWGPYLREAIGHVAPMLLILPFSPDLLLSIIGVPVAIAFCGYYLFVVAWPAAVFGLAFGSVGALVGGMLARARIDTRGLDLSRARFR